MLLEAYLQAIAKATDDVERDRMIAAALAVTIPDRWQKNVPVQVTRARVAIAADKRDMFDEAMGHLASTKISGEEFNRLNSQWEETHWVQ